MAEEFRPTDLYTIAEGAMVELFEHELRRVVQNIDDINTVATQKRKLILTIEFKPDDERREVGLSVMAESKLAGVRAKHAMLYIVRRQSGRLDMVSPMLRQANLFDEPRREPIDKAEGEGK